MVSIGTLPGGTLFMHECETYISTMHMSATKHGHRQCVNVRTGEIEELNASRLAFLSDLSFAPSKDWTNRPMRKVDAA